ncbi:unnamed protein product, partial [Effrenium voratum]
ARQRKRVEVQAASSSCLLKTSRQFRSLAQCFDPTTRPRARHMVQLCYEKTFITVKDAIGSARARSSPVRTLRRSSPEALYVASLQRAIGLTPPIPVPTHEPAAVHEAEAEAVRAAEDVAAASEAEAPAKEAAVSFGSLGHPELCFKPCLFMTRGGCPRGGECNFCHLPHQPAKLNSRMRETLSGLCQAEILALVLPYLHAKNVAGADCLLAEMESRLAALPRAGCAVPPSMISELNRALRRLSFRQLILLSGTRAEAELERLQWLAA